MFCGCFLRVRPNAWYANKSSPRNRSFNRAVRVHLEDLDKIRESLIFEACRTTGCGWTKSLKVAVRDYSKSCSLVRNERDSRNRDVAANVSDHTVMISMDTSTKKPAPLDPSNLGTKE